jgi:hypothetical protein
MTSNAFSLAKASIVMVPAGPVPIIATRLANTIVSNNSETFKLGHDAASKNTNNQNRRLVMLSEFNRCLHGIANTVVTHNASPGE